MQLGIAALFIIWVISRSNLSTTPSSNGNNTPSGEWIEQNFGDFPITFEQPHVEGFARNIGRVGIQMWTGQPNKFRYYVQYQQSKGSWWNKTPDSTLYSGKTEVEAAARAWLNANAPPETSVQNVKAPEAPPEEVEVQDFTIIDTTGRMQKAINQQAETLSLNGTQDYALNG
jgi:hypothetical protein